MNKLEKMEKEKQDMQKKLYHQYQLYWMTKNGYSLDDLRDKIVQSCNDQATDFANEAWDDPDARPDMAFSVCDAFRTENGTGMKNFAEFLSGEYKDPAYVQRLFATVPQTEQRQNAWDIYCKEYYEFHKDDPDDVVRSVDGYFVVTGEIGHRTHIFGCYTVMSQARLCLSNAIAAWMMSEPFSVCPLQAMHEIAVRAVANPKKAASVYPFFDVDDDNNLVYTGTDDEKVYFAIRESVIPL